MESVRTHWEEPGLGCNDAILSNPLKVMRALGMVGARTEGEGLGAVGADV